MGWTPQTAQTLSGTSVTFGSLPACNIIQIPVRDLTISGGGAHHLIQLGTSGGIKETGYTSLTVTHTASTFSPVTSSAGLPIWGEVAHGVMTLANLTGNVWVMSFSGLKSDGTAVVVSAGRVDLGGTLTQIRIIASVGGKTYSAGKANVLTATWERATVIDVSGGGAPHAFTGLPAGIEAAYLVFDQVSLNGTDNGLVQLGDSTGFYTTGYGANSFIRGGATIDAIANDSNAAGLFAVFGSAAASNSGMMRLVKPRDHYWAASHILDRSDSNIIYGTGKRQITNALSQIRFDAVGTNDTDAGQVGLLYI